MMFSCQEQLEDTYLKHIVYELLIQKGDEKPYGAEVFSTFIYFILRGKWRFSFIFSIISKGVLCFFSIFFNLGRKKGDIDFLISPSF